MKKKYYLNLVKNILFQLHASLKHYFGNESNEALKWLIGLITAQKINTPL